MNLCITYKCYILIKLMFQPNVCNGCHDVLMMSMNFSNISNLDIHGFNYCCIINRISKSEAVNLLQNSDLSKKNWNNKKYNFFYCVKGG